VQTTRIFRPDFNAPRWLSKNILKDILLEPCAVGVIQEGETFSEFVLHQEAAEMYSSQIALNFGSKEAMTKAIKNQVVNVDATKPTL